MIKKTSFNSEKYGNPIANQIAQPFVLPELPFSKDALEPHMSAKTFDFHHGKHHNAYVQALNKLIVNDELKSESLEQIIFSASQDSSKTAIFNNAAQIWNHTFFWNSMTPQGGGDPEGDIAQQINKDFGSYEKFCEDFKTAGTTQFGSGWAWLVYDIENGKLSIIKTANAETPITKNHAAIITCDVWEHAYYIDYQNRRVDYIDIFLKHLISWKFANENFERARG